ncbi:hypothetical protein ABBQ32_011529 [Trebouxia sp. C0010 RCD-2024]
MGLPVEARNEFCDRGGVNLVISPEDTGTVHYVLTGGIATDKLGKHHGQYNTLELGEVAPLDVAQIPVSLHLWVRALCTESNVTIRGYGMLQEVHPLQKANGQVQLELQLTSLTPKDIVKQHLFDVYWREEEESTRFNSPFTIESSVPIRDLAEHYMLHVGGFRQHIIYSPRVHNCQPVVSRQTPVLLTVIPHSHTGAEDPTRVGLTTRMITAHVKHHVMLGLAGTVHYNVEPFLTHLSEDPGIQALIMQGNLRLIKWDFEVQGYNPNGLVWHKNRAKALQYNHAILAHWGLDAYLNPVDIDEFMASREPFTVAELVADQRLVPKGQTNLYRYDIRCGTCQGQEADIWLHNSGRNPLLMYNETDWQPRLRGKPILYADTSFSMSIHESGVFHGALQQYRGFLFHLHVVNLFRYRRSASDNDKFSADTVWDWPVRPESMSLPA